MKRAGTILLDTVFIFVIALLLVISFLSYRRITRFDSAHTWVNHSNLVKLRLEKTLSLLKDAGMRQEGFLLTRDSLFLLPATGEEGKIDVLISELDSLTDDNREQQAKLISLQTLIGLQIDDFATIRKMSDKPLVSIYPYLVHGKQIMDQIRAVVNNMVDFEDQLLLKRTRDKDEYATITPLYSLIFSIFAILIVGVAYFRLRSETRLRFQAQDSQATIQNFFMQVPAMLAILEGPEHIFEFANPLYLEFIGDRDIVGKKLIDALPEIGAQGYVELLDKVYHTGEPFIGKEMPLSLVRENGKTEQVYINFIYQAFVNEAGVKTGILVYCYDVSEMVLTRKKIEETEQRSRLAIEAAEMGAFDWDFANQVFLSSLRTNEIFGFGGRSDVSHQDLLDTFNPDDKQIRDQAVLDSYTRGSLVYEARINWPDKTTHWINVHGKAIFNEKQEATRMYGTVMDITRQKRILEDLRESESKFRLLADSMAQLIWTGDEKGNLNYFNAAVYSYSGLKDEELQLGAWINIVHPDDREENIKKWLYAIASGEEFFFEHRFRHYNGEYRWQLSRALPQKDETGKIQRWVGTSTDIHDQRNFRLELEKKVNERTQSLVQANAELERIIRELERSNSELESFNYVASHDLQEPLRKIIAFIQRITEKEKDNLSDLAKDYFARITGSASRMQSLIDAFLSYSQTSNASISFEQTDLNFLLEDVKTDLHEVIEEKKASIRSEPLPSLKVIPLQFHQLFINLISNSIKYAKTGTDPVIKISAQLIAGKEIGREWSDPGTSYWKISFEDNGIGFDQQYEHKIFELFQRLHGKSDYSGTGIGLAICKKIMRNHSGSVTATGEKGVGSVFSLFVPNSL
jgi:PAS domain S-box-containing protein